MANTPQAPPLRSPFFDGDGTPAAAKAVRQLGTINRSWAGFLSKGQPWVNYGTHQQRTVLTVQGYVGASGVPDGALYEETDRTVLYQSQLLKVSATVYTATWVYVAGTMTGLTAQQPADLTAADAGFLFYATDTHIESMWTGAAWIPIELGTIEDTHANRLANYPAASYPLGTLFFETNPTQTDRQSLYAVQLNNAGAHTWAYVAGWCEKTFSLRPSDLGASDTGFLFYATDYTVTERWNGTHWLYVAGITQGTFAELSTLSGLLTASEAGWLLADSTYGHTWIWNGSWAFAQGEQSQYIVMGPASPQGGVWYPCDGGTYTCANANGTTANIVTPALNTNVAAIMGGGASGTLHAATAATPATTQGVTIGGAGPAIVALNAPSVANGGLPQYFTTSWWLRA
jgi:hypothetical protein